MEEKNKVSILKLAMDIFQNFFKLLGDLRKLANLEAQLARKSLVKIIILSFFLATIFTATWLCILGLIVATLMAYGFNLITAISIVTLINIFIIAVSVICILKLKNDLSFHATRRQLKHTQTLIKGH